LRRGAFFFAVLLSTIGVGLSIYPSSPAADVQVPSSIRQNCPAFAQTESVVVAGIDDGDTLRLADGRRVRLIGVNTPELGRQGLPDQPLAQRARKAVQTFLAVGSRAGLLLDAGGRDHYGRTLAHLYDSHGNSLEVYLLSRGLAWHVAIPPNLRLADCLAAVEQEARNAGKGLWGSAGIPPVAATAVNTGGYQRIRGKLLEVRFSRAWWLNLEGNLAAVIYPEHQHRFDRRQLRQLQGRRIELQGWVYPSGSARFRPWRMKLETPFALERL